MELPHVAVDDFECARASKIEVTVTQPTASSWSVEEVDCTYQLHASGPA